MPQQEKRFTARHVDAQFEHYTQAAFPPEDTTNTPNRRVVQSLQTLYGKQIQDEQQSLERIQQRLALAIAQQQQVTHEGVPAIDNVLTMPHTRVPVRGVIKPQRPWLKILERGLVALLVMSIVAGWVALSHWPRSSIGSKPPSGALVSTIQGDFSRANEWSSDSRTFVSLQTNTQKNELDVHMLDVATGHTTLYPVLDPSWISALKASNPFQILMGRYLLAIRSQGNNQATMVIWDITGHRAITTQMLPAEIGEGGRVLLPWTTSHNEDKLAIYFPDGTVTIWNVASGQKSVTCEARIPLNPLNRPQFQINPLQFQWYNHDQDLLLYTTGANTIQLDACNVTTGARLFNLDNIGAGDTFVGPFVSPDSKYIAISLDSFQKTITSSGTTTSYHIGTMKILDAYSGQILLSYHLGQSNQTVMSFFWLPDSKRLLMDREIYSNSKSTSSPSNSTEQISIWNPFTNQTTFVPSSSQDVLVRSTQDGRYLMLGTSNMRTVDIWQTSNDQKVATATTPGVQYTPDSFFYINNEQMIIGQKGNFDIWNISTGKLLYRYHGTTPFSIPGVAGSIVSWSPDGKYLTMMAGKTAWIGDGMLSIWRIP